MTSPNPLADHYQRALRADEVLAQIDSHYPAGPTLHQLAPLDQLHIGGVAASARLLQRLNPDTHSKVLDIGAGLGGLMRQGASLGFQITGLDITHGFSALNKALSLRVNQPDSLPLTWVTGNASTLPFADNSFDAVLFQHSLLNMPDAAKVIAESRRVLRPGGQLVMHEVISGPNVAHLRYPVPWAASSEHSHLMSSVELTCLLEKGGFQLEHEEDWSKIALEWRQRQRQKEQTPRQAVLSPQWVFGERFITMGKNLVDNLAEGAIKVVEIQASC
ncbi:MULTISPECIES: class I SAM-dependent methyltransferase [unclassified Halomonas]|uniref:class I SAM-dependent methyltransferase n=1 Tax=unclassified Halomonas TaxID=2609666 RepID=UPI0007D9CC4F|nr:MULTISPECIES: class I SAM-dependent methyltransferase [unclassified Halomonas]MBT2788277.1 class I SAM-dependent methyltransferase [Halomonas sp. ISL-106]MBT2796026.1 class I SAM-dependent methyltransferase [Halomonas sp. ISL-104]OAL61296.1 ubiquinone biosynthesis methyltransferase UbiE [Halomonas sp. ALS9]